MLSRELSFFFLHNTKYSQKNNLAILIVILNTTYIIILLQQKLLNFDIFFFIIVKTINLKYTDVEYIVVKDYKEEALSKSEYFNDRLKSEYVKKLKTFNVLK